VRTKLSIGVVVAMTAALFAVLATTSGAGAQPVKCKVGSITWKITGKKTNRITHAHGYQLPPGGSMSITKSASKVATLTSSVKKSAGGSVNAGNVLVHAEAHFQVDLAKSGSRTTSSSIKVSSQIAKSRKDRYIAAWGGRKYFTGKWTKYSCDIPSVGYKPEARGTWHSYGPASDGLALCPAKRYHRGSLPYIACRQVWH
jgi:hypothetical protein